MHSKFEEKLIENIYNINMIFHIVISVKEQIYILKMQIQKAQGYERY